MSPKLNIHAVSLKVKFSAVRTEDLDNTNTQKEENLI